MKKLFVILFALCAFGTASAQSSKLLQYGVKLEYSSKTLDQLMGDIGTEISNPSTEFLRQCDLGLMIRIRLGDIVYLQPEANFSINSVWDSVAAQPTFMDASSAAIRELKGVGLSIPVLLGARIFHMGDFIMIRIFAGPEFYTTYEKAAGGVFDYKDYSLVGGVGFDISKRFYADARISRFSTGDIYYRIGIGIFF